MIKRLTAAGPRLALLMNKYRYTIHLFWGGYFATLILVELVFFAILCSLLHYSKIVFLGRNLYSASNQNTMLRIKEWHTNSSFDPWWHCFPPWLSTRPTLQMANILLPHHWFSLRSLGGVGSTDPRKDTFCTLEGRDKVSDLKKELSPNSIQPSPAQNSFLGTFFLCQPVVRVLLWITCLD